MLTAIIQYLLSPTVFLLTFILPVVFFFLNHRYVWLSILLTAIIEVIIYWGELWYYESCGLVILFISIQLALMAVIILILKAVFPKRNKK